MTYRTKVAAVLVVVVIAFGVLILSLNRVSGASSPSEPPHQVERRNEITQVDIRS